jgi:hypothetical protein
MPRLRMRHRLDFERAGTLVVVLLTVVTLAGASVAGGIKLAASDLRQRIHIAEHVASPESHFLLGPPMSALLAADVAPDDYIATDNRANELDHRSDRLLEATAVVALVGMLAGLLLTPTASSVRRARAATMPLANTRSNGTV